MILRLLALAATAPRWLVIAGAAALSLASHSAAYRLGAAHEFRAGYAAGRAAAEDRRRAASGERAVRQIEDRLNAETAPLPSPPSAPGPDGLRCGPSVRDCPVRPGR